MDHSLSGLRFQSVNCDNLIRNINKKLRFQQFRLQIKVFIRADKFAEIN